MGICPRCGSWFDEGEPYCPECCYGGSGSNSRIRVNIHLEKVIEVNGCEYYAEDVEDALSEMGYDLSDLEDGNVDEYELERILEDY